jgi:hypothetical protein
MTDISGEWSACEWHVGTLCGAWGALAAHRIFRRRVGVCSESDSFDFGRFGLLFEWAFQRWQHLDLVVTGTMRGWKRQREVAAREVVNGGVSFTGGKSRTLQICFWTFYSRLDCQKAEKNPKQHLPSQERASSQERAPKNRLKNAENSSEGHQKDTGKIL